MSFNIPNQNNEFFYVVKNPQSVDTSAAVKEHATGTLNSVDYKILEFSSSHSFHVSTDYAQQITAREMIISLLSPAFVDWDDLNDPVKHMATHALIRPFEENDSLFCSYLITDTKAHLRYVIGANSTEIHDMYNNELLALGVDLAMGDVGAAATYLGTLTGTILQGATGLGTVAQWDQLIMHVNMMAGPFLKKFPR